MDFKYLFLGLLWGTAAAQPRMGDVEVERKQAYSRNFVSNPSAEKVTTGWTASSVTAARDTDAADAYEGIASFALTSATNPATFCTSDISLPEPYDDGVNGEVNVWFKGDASKWQLELRSSGGSSVLTDVDLTNVSTWTKASFNYPMADSYRVCVSSNAASPANINVAGFYWGPATNLSQVAQAEALVLASRTSSNQTISSTSPTTLVYNTETYDTYSEYDPATGVFTAKRSGRYLVSASAALNSTTSGEFYYVRADKNDVTGFCQGASNIASTSTEPKLVACIIDLAAGDTIRFKGISTSDTSYDFAVSTASYMTITRFPSASEIAVRPDQAGLTPWVSTTLTGSLSTNATYTGYTRRVGDEQWVRGAIAFSGTNTQGAVTINVPNCTIDTAKLATSTNANLILGRAAIFDSGTDNFFATVRYNNTTSVTISMLTDDAGGGNYINPANMDTSTNVPITIANGDRVTFDFAVPCVGWSYTQPAPLLVGSVTSQYSGLTRIEAAKLNCDAGSAITSQQGTWVSSIGNVSAGSCVVTLVTGIFSSTPYCWATWDGTVANNIIFANASNATTVSFGAVTDSGASSTTINGTMFCMGPR